MKHFIKQLYVDAFASYAFLSMRRISRKYIAERRIRAHLLLLHMLTLLGFLLLFASRALSQESDPKFKFTQPSDEMDFTLPPIADMPHGQEKKTDTPAKGSITKESPPPPPLYGFESSPAPGQQKGKEKDGKTIDQFFSTTTVLSPDQEKEEKPAQATAAVEEKKDDKNKRKKKKIQMYPAHEFKSVRLPSTIYHKNYSFENTYLPFAYNEEDQQKLLAVAASEGNVEGLRTLYNNGGRIDWRDAKGTPLLILAVQHRQPNTARWLLQHRANPDDIDGSGLAALHYAAYEGNHEIVELLLEFGASRDLPDTRGKTPLMYAQLHPVSNVVQHMLAF